MMTGRDLIIYILENGLEDKEVLDGGKIIGFETLYGLAEKKDTGVETIFALCKMRDVPTVLINNKVCIPVFAIEQFQ